MGKTARKHRKNREYDKLPKAEKASPYDFHDGKGPRHVDNDLLSSPREFVPLDQLAPGHASPIQVMLTMMTTSVGATVVVLPYAFLQGGFAMSIFMVLFVSLAAHRSRTRLVELGVDQGIYSFQGLAKVAFGPLGSFTVAANQLAVSLGLIIALLFITFQDAPIILGHWLKMDFGPDGRPIVQPGVRTSPFLVLLADKFWFAEALTLLIVLPYCLLASSYKRLCLTPALVTITLAFTSYSVIAKAPADHKINVLTSSQGYDRDYLTVPSTVCQAFAIITVSIMSQHHSFHAFYSMEDRSVETFNRLSLIAALGSTAIALCVGIGGYVSFLGATKSDVLHNYDFTTDRALLPFWSFVPLTAVACAGFEVVVSRHSAQFLTRPSTHIEENEQDVLFASQQPAKSAIVEQENDQNGSWTASLLSAIALIIIAQVAIFYVQDVATVLSLTGGLAGITLCFILPAACQLKLSNTYDGWWSERALPVLSIIVGIAASAAAVISTAVHLQEQSVNTSS